MRAPLHRVLDAHSIPAGWMFMCFATLRWNYEGTWEANPPLWGFPVPWAQASMASSLHWHIAIPGLMLNLLVYSFAMAIVGEVIHSRLPPASKLWRRLGWPTTIPTPCLRPLDLVHSGHTGTNVMDIQLVLVGVAPGEAAEPVSTRAHRQ